MSLFFRANQAKKSIKSLKEAAYGWLSRMWLFMPEENRLKQDQFKLINICLEGLKGVFLFGESNNKHLYTKMTVKSVILYQKNHDVDAVSLSALFMCYGSFRRPEGQIESPSFNVSLKLIVHSGTIHSIPASNIFRFSTRRMWLSND